MKGMMTRQIPQNVLTVTLKWPKGKRNLKDMNAQNSTEFVDCDAQVTEEEKFKRNERTKLHGIC
jgi:hypothetical protein